MEKRAVLVISFGTSYGETRKKTIEAIESDIRQAFPGYEFRRAFTSPTIIRIMKNRDQIQVDNLEQALERLLAEGYRTVIAQTTYVIRGFEYDRMMATIRNYQERFDCLVCGEPLLTDEADYRACVEVLKQELAPYRREDQYLLLMGHGTEHVANFSYERLQKALDAAGLTDLRVGTVEPSPTQQAMERTVAEHRRERLFLTPFMVVAGDHASNDMAGDQEDSWKSRFERDGFSVTCLMKGLGEYEGIRRLYTAHAKAAARAAEERMEAAFGADVNGADVIGGTDVSGADKAAAGVLYGIGVGPGDPELMTLKAVRTIRESDVIAVPGQDYRSSIAYQIALRAVPELEKKECFSVPMPMTRDRETLRASHEAAAEKVAAYLNQGKNVGFLNLGDVTVYATYLYIHRKIREKGYQAELINSVPSFCAAAASLGVGLGENSDQIHILSQPDQIEEGLKLPGTKIIMKMGKNIGQVKEWIRQAGLEAMMVENCGMPGERLVYSTEDIREEAGYYSLLIVKEPRKAETPEDTCIF